MHIGTLFPDGIYLMWNGVAYAICINKFDYVNYTATFTDLCPYVIDLPENIKYFLINNSGIRCTVGAERSEFPIQYYTEHPIHDVHNFFKDCSEHIKRES